MGLEVTSAESATISTSHPFRPDPRAEPEQAPVRVVEPSDGVTEEQEARAGVTPAARMRARMRQLEEREEQFPVPPRDVWRGDLVMVAKPVTIEAGMRAVALIAAATKQMLWRDDDGELRPVEACEWETLELDEHGMPVDGEPMGQCAPGWLGVAQLAGLVDGEGRSLATRKPMSVGQIIVQVVKTTEALVIWSDDVASWIAGTRTAMERALGE